MFPNQNAINTLNNFPYFVYFTKITDLKGKIMFRTQEELQTAIAKFNIQLVSKDVVVEERSYDMSTLTELDVNDQYGISQLEYDVFDSTTDESVEPTFEYVSDNHEISVVLSNPDDNKTSIAELNNYIGLLENWKVNAS